MMVVFFFDERGISIPCQTNGIDVLKEQLYIVVYESVSEVISAVTDCHM